MGNKSQTIVDAMLVFLISAVTFCLFLGSYHLITPDEGRYVEVAREMLSSGNFITPHLNGIVFLDKPALYYWFQAAMIKLFGLNEWSVRILPAFFGVLGCVMTYFAGRQFYSRRAGFVSALILMTAVLYFLSAHYADMDLMVAVLISTSLFLFMMAAQLPRGARSSIYLWLAYAFAAFAVLTKGLMGIVFPVMIVGAWIVLMWQWQIILRMRLISGLLLFLVICLPWYVLVQRQNPEFLHYFFGVQQFSRFLTKDFNMQQPIYYYAVVVAVGFLPWTIFLYQSLASAVKKVWRLRRSAKVDSFLLLWAGLIFVFFSIPDSKIPGYIIPVFPALALLMGSYFSEYWDQLSGTKNVKASATAFFFLTVLGAIALVVASQMPSISRSESLPFLLVMAVALFVGGAMTVYFAFSGKRFARVFSAIVLTCMTFSIVGVASIHTYKLNNVKPIAKIINQAFKPGDKVISFEKYYQDLPVYTQKRIYVVSEWGDPNIAHHDNWKRELAEGIIYRHVKQPWLINNGGLLAMWNSHGRVFVVLDQHRFARFKRVITSRIYVLDHYDLGKTQVLLLSNQQ